MNMREQLARALLAEMQRQFPTITSSSEDGRVLEFLPCVDAILDAMRKPENEDILQPIYLASYAASEYGNDDSLETWQDVIDAIQAGK